MLSIEKLSLYRRSLGLHLKFDVSNSDFLDCNTRIRNNSFGMWNGGTGMLDGESRMWEGGTGMRDGGTGVWDGGVGMSSDGAEVWDRCPKAWTFNTIFEVNRKFLDNCTILKTIIIN
jgi:hypothetical protein